MPSHIVRDDIQTSDLDSHPKAMPSQHSLQDGDSSQVVTAQSNRPELVYFDLLEPWVARAWCAEEQKEFRQGFFELKDRFSQGQE